MFRKTLLLVRQTRSACRQYLRTQRVELDTERQADKALRSTFGKSLAFAVGSTTLFYTGATLVTYERARATQLRRLKFPPQKWYEELAVVKWWKKQRPSDKVFYGILTANGIVFLMWQIPRFSNVMCKYFAHSPTSNTALPMLLSVFSHKSPLHLGCNMLVLHSFMGAAVTVMGPEQFLATYLSGGVISALVSHMGKLYTQSRAASLGASGAILTCIACFCMAFPDAQMQILFLPFVTFKAITGLTGIMVFDAVGLLSKWAILDHAAHLGGALFGIGYFYGGQQLYFSYFKKLVQYWDGIRSGHRPDK